MIISCKQNCKQWSESDSLCFFENHNSYLPIYFEILFLTSNEVCSKGEARTAKTLIKKQIGTKFYLSSGRK